jgi:hypothetical protein
MKAVVLEKKQELTIRDIDLPLEVSILRQSRGTSLLD